MLLHPMPTRLTPTTVPIARHNNMYSLIAFLIAFSPLLPITYFAMPAALPHGGALRCFAGVSQRSDVSAPPPPWSPPVAH